MVAINHVYKTNHRNQLAGNAFLDVVYRNHNHDRSLRTVAIPTNDSILVQSIKLFPVWRLLCRHNFRWITKMDWVWVVPKWEDNNVLQ